MKTLCIWLLICSVVTEYLSSAEFSKSDEFDKENSIEENNEQLIQSNNEKNKRRLYLLKIERLDVFALQDPPMLTCGGPGDYCNESMLCCKGYDCVTKSTGPGYPVCTSINRKLHVSKTRHCQPDGKKKPNSQPFVNLLTALAFQDPPTTDCGGPGDNCSTSMPCCGPFECASDEEGSNTVCKAFGRRSSHVSKIRQRQPDGKKKLNSQPFVNLLNTLAFQDPPTTDCGVLGDNCSTSMPCCGPFECASDEEGSDTVCKAFGRRSSHVSKIRQRQPDGKKKLNFQPFVNLNALAFQDPPTNCSDAGVFCNTTMLCCEGYACVIVGSFPVCAAIHL